MRANGSLRTRKAAECFTVDESDATAMTTPGAILEITAWDNDGHPLTTKQTVTGFDGTQHPFSGQTHEWNLHGERTSWSVPFLGTLPNGWTQKVFEDHDEAGNVTAIRRVQAGDGTTATLMSAQYRGAGRPDSRTITTSCTLVASCSSASLVRQYGYDGDGQMNDLSVMVGSTLLAGSHITYDGLRIHDIQLEGFAGGSARSSFKYDRRGRCYR